MRLRSPIALLALLAAGAAQADTGEFAFALIGDTPYSRFERQWFADYLQRIEADQIELIIHAGDFKSGSEPCDDALFADRRALFDAARVPFVLVPGDNDWSDCNRLAAGRFDPLERLAALRRTFFPHGESLGQRRLAVASQGDGAAHPAFRENLRWQLGGVSFVTLNMVGPGNLRGRSPTPPAEYIARNRANLDWLRGAFEDARRAGSAALVVAIQADPEIEDFEDGEAKPGYRDFLELLRSEARRFAGEVLLVHGDGHRHRIDQPFSAADGTALRNFTRIETYGSPFMGWVRVAVRPGRQPLLEFRSRTYAPDPGRARTSP